MSATIVRTAANGVDFCTAQNLIRENLERQGEGFRFATNREVDAILLGAQYRSFSAVFPCWTGTGVLYEAPGKKFGSTVEYISKPNKPLSYFREHPEQCYKVVVEVPKRFQGMKNTAIALEHPDWELERKGNIYIFKIDSHHRRPIRVIKNFPEVSVWKYFNDEDEGVDDEFNDEFNDEDEGIDDEDKGIDDEDKGINDEYKGVGMPTGPNAFPGEGRYIHREACHAWVGPVVRNDSDGIFDARHDIIMFWSPDAHLGVLGMGSWRGAAALQNSSIVPQNRQSSVEVQSQKAAAPQNGVVINGITLSPEEVKVLQDEHAVLAGTVNPKLIEEYGKLLRKFEQQA